jgi:hypothetical protein
MDINYNENNLDKLDKFNEIKIKKFIKYIDGHIYQKIYVLNYRYILICN